MSPLEALAVLAAGVAAGTMNAVVGSGTLVSFPVLLAVGLPPVAANITNTIGLVPGSVGGAWGYRRELVGQRRRVLVLGAAALVGGTAGGVLLLLLPPEVFQTVVPVLVVLSLVLVVAQPALTRRVQRRRRHSGSGPTGVGAAPAAAALGTAVYGGYFGAAQGVLLLAILGIGVADSLQRHNAAKNVLAGLVNAVAALIFVLVAEVNWAAAGLIAAGAVVGGQVGATVGRRLPPLVLRGVIVLVGTVAIVAFVAD